MQAMLVINKYTMDPFSVTLSTQTNLLPSQLRERPCVNELKKVTHKITKYTEKIYKIVKLYRKDTETKPQRE